MADGMLQYGDPWNKLEWPSSDLDRQVKRYYGLSKRYIDNAMVEVACGPLEASGRPALGKRGSGSKGRCVEPWRTIAGQCRGGEVHSLI